ncbi:MAG: hydroxymethylbilane synthase [Spirosomaceae bacterium]|jgi:hydroxymethylbilane synthase|nr:hydroxymethylbilane synthase [Spirosomataceae bacterium]
MHIKIGTRGSKLALWQAYYVQEKLEKGGLTTEIVIIETKGDQILDRSLSKIGSKGVFTQELEDQLRDGRIDIAVHSAKDLQSQLDDDLQLIAFTERELVNDVLVSHNKNLTLSTARAAPLNSTFTIGTSSTRRVAMLRHFYPNVKTVDMRGNFQTRLRKLEDGHCDALLLAYAGVHRMEYDSLIVEHLPLDKFTPAVGQGSVAIECSESLDEVKKQQIRQLLNHPNTERCLLAERAFLRTLQGGCSVPVFGLATLENEQISMTGGVISLNGQEMLKQTATGQNPTEIGETLAQALLKLGAKRILDEIKNA